MLDAGVIVPVTEPTPWIKSFVIVETTDQHGNPKMHICLDSTPLNKAVIREPYHYQSPDDEIYNPLPNVIGITNDIIIWGDKEDGSDHDVALARFLQVTCENGLRINFDKIQYHQRAQTSQ